MDIRFFPCELFYRFCFWQEAQNKYIMPLGGSF